MLKKIVAYICGEQYVLDQKKRTGFTTVADKQHYATYSDGSSLLLNTDGFMELLKTEKTPLWLDVFIGLWSVAMVFGVVSLFLW